jgi:hypothetical protein
MDTDGRISTFSSSSSSSSSCPPPNAQAKAFILGNRYD